MKSPLDYTALLRVLLALICLATMPDRAIAQAAHDPSDLYVQAYLKMRDASNLEKKQDYRSAYKSFVEASRLFDAVAKTYPSWKPEIVSYRRKKMRDIISDLQEKARRNLGGDLTLPKPATPAQTATADDPLPLPKRPENPGLTASNVQPNVVAKIPQDNPVTEERDTESINAATSHIEAKFRELRTRISQLDAEKAHLTQRLVSKESELTAAQQEIVDARRAQAELQSRLLESEGQLQTSGNTSDLAALRDEVATLKAQLTIAKASLETAGLHTTELLAALETARTEISLLKEERSQLITERHQMSEILGDIEADGSLSVNNLLALNQNLRRQLETARTAAEQLALARDQDKEQIDVLKSQVSGVSQELEKLRSQNSTYRQEIAQLTQKLEHASSDLAMASAGVLNEEALEENRMLRDVLLRQLQQQARRQQSKELVLQELAKLEINSRTLLDHIEEIAGAGVDLTEEERALFKGPIAAMLLGESGMHGTLISSNRGSTKPAPPEEAPAAPDHGDTRAAMAQKARIAALHFQKQRYAEAEQLYEDILRMDRQNVYNLCNLGIIKVHLKNHEEAEVLLSKALAYDPDHPQAHLMLGVSLFQQKKYDPALESIGHAARLDPQNERAHQYLGLIYSHKGWRKRAEDEFKQAISIDPGFAEAHFNLSILYATSDDSSRELAEKHYQEAVTLGAKRDPVMEEFLRG